MFWSIVLGMMLTALLIVLNLKKFYDYYLGCRAEKQQSIYNACPIGISVEEKIDKLIKKQDESMNELIFKQDKSWERGTKRIEREKIDDEIKDIQSDAISILLRFADADETLNGEVKATIKKFSKLKEKKAEFIRNELIE